MASGPICYFNNCRGRVYLAHYGPHGVRDAFYDLYTQGVQATQATNLQPGQLCIVATVTKADRRKHTLPKRPVTFSRYRFERVEEHLDLAGELCRVFCGKRIGTDQVHQQGVAPQHYPMFFNALGHFLQQSTIDP